MKFPRLINHTGRVLLASAVIGLTLIGTSPAEVKAAPDPVDLELDAIGYTPIIANNLEPGDSGTKTVELRNVGTSDGFVTIWLSDIISGEGDNPESETGDTSGAGEFEQYLTLDITVDGLNTNLDLPAAVADLPASVIEEDYIEVIPLKAGETRTLEWHWELPADTGNAVQGDELSFTINYLLREMVITNVSTVVTTEGEFTEDVTVKSETEKGQIKINVNTTAKTADNQTPDDLWLIEMDNTVARVPENKSAVGFPYELGPEGTTFDKPVTITLSYKPENIPAGVSESELEIALWDKAAKKWITLSNCTVNTQTKTISAQITHFSRYTVFSPNTSSIPPAIPLVVIEPEEPEVIPPRLLEVNLLDEETVVEISEDGVISDTLILADRDGNFVVEIKGGSRITGTGGEKLSRIDLREIERTLILPDDTILLSPAYLLTGYNEEHKETEIIISPSATLSIRYDTVDLPENAFLPYIAIYTDSDELVPLEMPLGSLVTLGTAEALITGSALYVVAVEIAPPPPPLPADFISSNLIINPAEIMAGDPVKISVTITNGGELSGTYEVYLVIDGIVRATREVALTGKSSETLTFEVSNLSPGTHQIRLAGLNGSIEVTRVTVEPGGSRVNWLGLDLSIAGAVVLGLLIWHVMLLRARRRETSG